MVPLLAEAGVTFLHLGVNPAWPVPEVPAVFRWRSPDGAEVVVAYQAGGYGGDVVVPGCPDVLAFLHAGDNLGPPSADEVVAAHADLAQRYPGAAVQGSTLDAFARALAASGAVADLPVVTAEIGDPWLFGAGSDPSKVSAYRTALRARREASDTVRAGADRSLLLVAEHTWGLDQKESLPDAVRWDRAGLAELRSTDAGRHFEASWAEQRAYVDEAARTLGLPSIAERATAIEAEVHGWGDAVAAGGWTVVEPGAVVDVGGWSLALGGSGEVVHLAEVATGRVLADDGHPMGLVRYQSFDEADYERFYAQLSPTPEDEWWARWDNTKPGIDAAGAVSGDRGRRRWWGRGSEMSARRCWRGWRSRGWRRTASAPHPKPGSAGRRRGDGGVDLAVAWAAKPANRLPEALWCSFVPVQAEPDGWRSSKSWATPSPPSTLCVGAGGPCTRWARAWATTVPTARSASPRTTRRSWRPVSVACSTPTHRSRIWPAASTCSCTTTAGAPTSPCGGRARPGSPHDPDGGSGASRLVRPPAPGRRGPDAGGRSAQLTGWPASGAV